MIHPLILASSSPRRQQIVAAMGLAYHIIKPQIDESQHPAEAPLHYVRRLAEEKASAVAQQLQQSPMNNSLAIALAADTVVILAADTTGWQENGVILGKPADADEARAMLGKLRHRPHTVCTAYAIWQVGMGLHHINHVATTVHMRDYSDAEIETYIASGDPFDKAGGYAIQHPEFAPVARIDGSYTNVVGLPAQEVSASLRQVGIPARDIPDDFAP